MCHRLLRWLGLLQIRWGGEAESLVDYPLNLGDLRVQQPIDVADPLCWLPQDTRERPGCCSLRVEGLQPDIDEYSEFATSEVSTRSPERE